MCWRLPIFPDRYQSSIFGTSELNFRVRNGNGWTLTVMNTNCNWLLPSTYVFSFALLALTDKYLVYSSVRNGTPSGARTLDTLIKSQVLYQLS